MRQRSSLLSGVLLLGIITTPGVGVLVAEGILVTSGVDTVIVTSTGAFASGILVGTLGDALACTPDLLAVAKGLWAVVGSAGAITSTEGLTVAVRFSKSDPVARGVVDRA